MFMVNGDFCAQLEKELIRTLRVEYDKFLGKKMYALTVGISAIVSSQFKTNFGIMLAHSLNGSLF